MIVLFVTNSPSWHNREKKHRCFPPIIQFRLRAGESGGWLSIPGIFILPTRYR